MIENNETKSEKRESYYGEHQLQEVIFTIVYTVILIFLMWGASIWIYK